MGKMEPSFSKIFYIENEKFDDQMLYIVCYTIHRISKEAIIAGIFENNVSSLPSRAEHISLVSWLGEAPERPQLPEQHQYSNVERKKAYGKTNLIENILQAFLG